MASDRIRMLPLFMPVVSARDLDWQPAADVYRTGKGWLIKFDLAGVRPEDVECLAARNQLTVRGVRRDCLLEEGCSHYRMEISYRRFERRIDIPGDLSSARITTEYRDGMLVIRVCWESPS